MSNSCFLLMRAVARNKRDEKSGNAPLNIGSLSMCQLLTMPTSGGRMFSDNQSTDEFKDHPNPAIRTGLSIVAAFDKQSKWDEADMDAISGEE